jgi:curved DNA-binding protein CbpA
MVMETTQQDPYAVLGLEPSASAEQVRQAYFRLVRQYTPEAHPEQFKRVRAAYETLRSPARRAEQAVLAFDESGAEVDLDLLAAAAGAGEFDAAEVLLAVELSASDFASTGFAENLTSIEAQDLLGV